MRFTAGIAILFSLGLAGCAPGVETISNHDGANRIDTTATQVSFPNGETGHVISIQHLDENGRPIPNAVTTYAFNGKSIGRALMDDVAGGVVIAAGGVTGAAILSHNGPQLVNNVRSVSASEASTSSSSSASAGVTVR
jgi:hypothetical protein